MRFYILGIRSLCNVHNSLFSWIIMVFFFLYSCYYIIIEMGFHRVDRHITYCVNYFIRFVLWNTKRPLLYITKLNLSQRPDCNFEYSKVYIVQRFSKWAQWLDELTSWIGSLIYLGLFKLNVTRGYSFKCKSSSSYYNQTGVI